MIPETLVFGVDPFFFRGEPTEPQKRTQPASADSLGGASGCGPLAAGKCSAGPAMQRIWRDLRHPVRCAARSDPRSSFGGFVFLHFSALVKSRGECLYF